MISRYFVIALAIGAGVFRASQGAWLEAAGLLSLGGGLIALKLSSTRPALRQVAYLGFMITALTFGAVIVRRFF